MTMIYLGQPGEAFAAKSYIKTCIDLAKDYSNMARKYKDSRDYFRSEAQRLRDTANAYKAGLKEYEARNGR